MIISLRRGDKKKKMGVGDAKNMQGRSEDTINARLQREWGQDGLYLYSGNRDVNKALKDFLDLLKEKYGTLDKADGLYIELTRQGKLEHLGSLKW